MKAKVLPGIVFSMGVPFTEAHVLEKYRSAQQEVGPLNNDIKMDLSLTVDLYLENLVRHGILVQNGSEYHFRSLGPIHSQDAA